MSYWYYLSTLDSRERYVNTDTSVMLKTDQEDPTSATFESVTTLFRVPLRCVPT